MVGAGASSELGDGDDSSVGEEDGRCCHEGMEGDLGFESDIVSVSGSVSTLRVEVRVQRQSKSGLREVREEETMDLPSPDLGPCELTSAVGTDSDGADLHDYIIKQYWCQM